MRIDSHQHFWKFDPVRDAWITPNMSVIQRDFLPEDLAPLLKENKMDGCIAVQADQSMEETQFLLSLANRHDFIKGVVGWIDLRAPNIVRQLHAFIDPYASKLVGFRHVLQSEPDAHFMLRSDFLYGIAALYPFNCTYDILVYPKQLPSVIKLVRGFPQQLFVLDHIAKPYIQKGLIKQWKKNMEALAEHSNVWCKLSGIITEAHWGRWTPEQIHPYLEVALETFGAKRLMFGSDWPVCLVAGSYARVVNLVEDYFSTLSETEQARIWGQNAKEFYLFPS